MAWRWLIWLACALALCGGRAQAHPMPKSLVELRVLESEWQLHLRLPAERLETAFVQAGLVPDPGPGSDARPRLEAAAVRAYVVERIAVTSEGGRVWRVAVDRISPPAGDGDEWRLEVRLKPPPGASMQRVQLDYQVIVREIAMHIVVASMVQDWSGGVLPDAPRLLGAMRAQQTRLDIDRAEEQGWRAWLGMVLLGARHILAGADHLAFLLTLLLTIPPRAAHGRWRPLTELRPAVRNTLWWISAFTLGHSVALLAASLDWLPPSGKWVEVLIAASVGISAIHALRPFYPSREAWVAAGFGLVHGLAFADTMRALSLSPGRLVSATLAFNLGIELVQLALVLLLVPLLVACRHRAWSTLLRKGIGIAAMGSALAWAVAQAA